MDQAWLCEEDFWEAGTQGRVQDYYAHTLASDGFVVIPGGVLAREELMREWDDRAAWADYTLDERRDVLVNGETVVLSYRVRARQLGGGEYRARVSSVYTWVGRWVLALRQHTPDPDQSLDAVR